MIFLPSQVIILSKLPNSIIIKMTEVWPIIRSNEIMYKLFYLLLVIPPPNFNQPVLRRLLPPWLLALSPISFRWTAIVITWVATDWTSPEKTGLQQYGTQFLLTISHWKWCLWGGAPIPPNYAGLLMLPVTQTPLSDQQYYILAIS